MRRFQQYVVPIFSYLAHRWKTLSNSASLSGSFFFPFLSSLTTGWVTTRNFRAAASSDIFLSVRCLRNARPQGWAERAESAEDSRDESPPSEDEDDDDEEEAEDSRLLLLSEMSARSSSRVRGARDCTGQWGKVKKYIY